MEAEASSSKKRFGRPISFIWEVFTDENEPWKLRESKCLHCKQMVAYHKKSEYVLVHLNKCTHFLNHCKEQNKMELMYFVIRSMEEASKMKRTKRRHDKLVASGDVLGTFPETVRSLEEKAQALSWQAIDLSNSSPSIRSVPENLLTAAISEVLDPSFSETGLGSLSSHPLGYGDNTRYFTQALSKFLQKSGGRQEVDPNFLIPSAGASDGLHMLAKMVMRENGFRPGGFVFVEETTFIPACAIFTDRGFTLRTVASDENGLIVDDLRRQLQLYEAEKAAAEGMGHSMCAWPAMLYIISSFSNPTGSSLSLARRIELLQLTKAANLLVVSDDVYSLLDFTWELKMLQIKDRHKVYGHYPGSTNPINELGTDAKDMLRPLIDYKYKNVVSVSSFSKILAPGLRVGWIETCCPSIRDSLKRLAKSIASGSLCHFTACIVAQCITKDTTRVDLPPSHPLVKTSDLYRHVCELKNSFAKQYHALTSSLIKFSSLLLPPGEDNQIYIEGFSAIDSPDAPFSLLRSHSEFGQGCLPQPSSEFVMSQYASNYGYPPMLEACSSSSSGGSRPSASRQMQPRKRVGGVFVWVRLPVWVTPRQRHALSYYSGAPAGVPYGQPSVNFNSLGSNIDQMSHLSAGEMMFAPSPAPIYPMVYGAPPASYYLAPPSIPVMQVPIEPPSMQWLVEKARTEFLLDFKLGAECCPSGPNVINTDYMPHSMSNLYHLEKHRYVRLCFTRYDEEILEVGAERFVSLLAKIYAETMSSYGYMGLL